MVSIANVKLIDHNENKNRVIAEINVDETPELPEQEFEDYILTQGSSAYVIMRKITEMPIYQTITTNLR